MAGHDPHRLEHWRRLIDRWKASRLSINAFCRRHQLNIASFYRWRNILRQQPTPGPADPTTTSTPTPSLPFIPIRVIPDTTIDITLPSGLQLRVPLAADPRQLARLIQTLGETS